MLAFALSYIVFSYRPIGIIPYQGLLTGFRQMCKKKNAETTWKNQVFLGVFWRPWRDLNLRPFAYEHKKIPSKKLEF